MEKKLPVYKLVLKEGEEVSGVNYIALVDDPAIQVNWVAFDNHLKFAADKERKIIVSPAMIPDMPIFRRTKEMGEFYVILDKDTVNAIQEKFMENGFLHNINEMHDSKKKVEGVFMKNSFVSDKQMGIYPPDAFKDLPDGTWFISYKFKDDEVWDKFVKTGEFAGVSVEGYFDIEYLKKDSEDSLEQQIIDIIKEING